MKAFEYIDIELNKIIREYHSFSGLQISLSEIFTECKKIDEINFYGDFVIIAYILDKLNQIIPCHKWKKSEIVKAIKLSDIPNEVNDYKTFIFKQFKHYIK